MGTTEQARTQWVEIDRLTPHPKNDNEMDEAMMKKLQANIEQQDGKYPPIIVRTLENSEEFDGGDPDQLQIMDGEHRWRIEKLRGATHVFVDIWTGISDGRAELILATMNHNRGNPNRRKRKDLLASLLAREDFAAIEALVPESGEALRKVTEWKPDAELRSSGGAGAASDDDPANPEPARTLRDRQPITIWATKEAAGEIRSGIKRWLERHDPRHEIGDCREGEALAGICRDYE